jgi:hypothetical protein
MAFMQAFLEKLHLKCLHAMPMALFLLLSTVCPALSFAAEPLLEEEAETDQQFASYETARSALIKAMKAARYRVLVITHRLTDGDLATALHSLSIRNTFVQVMIDRRSVGLYNSRHTYLQSAQIPVFLARPALLNNETQSVFAIDNIAIRVSTALDSSWSGPVTVGPAPFHAGEIVALFSGVPLLKPVPQGAKTPTRVESAPTIKSGSIRTRARSLPQSGTGPLPRRLPGATRLQEIDAGRTSSDEQIRPVRELQNGVLKLDNESELAED